MKPTFIILLFSFIATCSTFAQQSSNYVSGRVTDTNGGPLPGATISIKGKGTGAVTTPTEHIHCNYPELACISLPPLT